MKMRFAWPILIALFVIGCAGRQSLVDLRNAPIRGNERAKTVVIVFSDFQCPFCKNAAAGLDEAYKKLHQDIVIYFKHFPLTYHPQALNAAKAAEAARRQGKFWEMHDLLFANAMDLRDGIYRRLAAELGLNADQFERDMNSFETANRISADKAEGQAVGVNATPYIIIDGVRYIGPNAYIPDALKSIVKYK